MARKASAGQQVVKRFLELSAQTSTFEASTPEQCRNYTMAIETFIKRTRLPVGVVDRTNTSFRLVRLQQPVVTVSPKKPIASPAPRSSDHIKAEIRKLALQGCTTVEIIDKLGIADMSRQKVGAIMRYAKQGQVTK